MRYGDHRASYPDAPGYRRQETSRAAAEAIAPREKSLRARVFDELKKGAATPEEMARRVSPPRWPCAPAWAACAVAISTA